MSKHTVENTNYTATVDYDRSEDRALLTFARKDGSWSQTERFSGIMAQAAALKALRHFFDDFAAPEDQPVPVRRGW